MRLADLTNIRPSNSVARVYFENIAFVIRHNSLLLERMEAFAAHGFHREDFSWLASLRRRRRRMEEFDPDRSAVLFSIQNCNGT